MLLVEDGKRQAGRDLARDGPRVRHPHDHHCDGSADGSGASRYLDSTAATRGKPSITVEAGHAGTVEPEDVAALVDGSLSVMRYLKMLPGSPAPVEHPVWIESVRTISSEADRNLLSAGCPRHLCGRRHEGGVRDRLRGTNGFRGPGAGRRRGPLHLRGALHAEGRDGRQHRGPVRLAGRSRNERKLRRSGV